MLIREALTMEETFILTGLAVLIIGTALGFLIEWLFRKENERNGADGKTENVRDE